MKTIPDWHLQVVAMFTKGDSWAEMVAATGRHESTLRNVVKYHNAQRPEGFRNPTGGRPQDATRTINDPTLRLISQHILFLRSVVLKKSYSELADIIGIPKNKLVRIIKQQEDLTITDLRKISSVLAIDLSTLFSAGSVSAAWMQEMKERYTHA